LQGKNHITYSSADIEKYLKGELTPTERHQLEKASLDDPFLADALEGYSNTPVNIQADLNELSRRLKKEEQQAKVVPMVTASRTGFPWLRAAVMIAVIAVAGWMVSEFAFNKKTPDIAHSNNSEPVKKTETPSSNETNARPDTIAAGNSNSNDEVAVQKPIPSESTYKQPTTSRKDADKTDNTGEVEIKPIVDEPLAQSTVTPDSRIEEEKLKREKELTAKSAQQEVLSNNQGRAVIIPPTDNALKTDNNIAKANTKNTQEKQEPQPDYNNVNVFQGQVLDANNNALPFVNITNAKDNVGTYTDARGNFTLVSTDSVLSVNVRSLGYENTKTVLSNENEINQIQLQEDRSMTARVLDTVKRNLSRARGNMKFEEPEPADGWDYYDSYLVNNLNVPETFERKLTQQGGGEVELSFEVNKHGEPINIKIEKSLCDKCDEEAIRLVKEGPKWKRKAKKGRTKVLVPFY
jgi:hypothetical protein